MHDIAADRGLVRQWSRRHISCLRWLPLSQQWVSRRGHRIPRRSQNRT